MNQDSLVTQVMLHKAVFIDGNLQMMYSRLMTLIEMYVKKDWM